MGMGSVKIAFLVIAAQVMSARASNELLSFRSALSGDFQYYLNCQKMCEDNSPGYVSGDGCSVCMLSICM